MSLNYAGVPLLPANSEQREFIEANISYNDIPIFTYRAFPGKNLTGLTLPTGFYPMKPVRLNRLYWYSGASRWGYGHFLCDSDQLADIHAAVYADNGLQKQPFIMTGGETLQTDLYVAYETPLSPIRGGAMAGLYMLTLVDPRYYWWSIPCPDFGIVNPCTQDSSSGSSGSNSSSEGISTWDDLFSDIEQALGKEIEWDEIDPVYLYPHESLNLKYEALPLVFDAIAWNVGMRVSYGFDGSINVRNFASDSAILTANFASHTGAVRAGGIRYQGVL